MAEPKGTPRLSGLALFRVLARPRGWHWWALWALAVAGAWALALWMAGALVRLTNSGSSFCSDLDRQVLWVRHWLTSYPALVAGALAFAVLPAVLASALLAADRRARRLEQLVLTPGDRLGILRAYHWQACAAALLVLAALAPFWLMVGRPPGQLLPLEAVRYSHRTFELANALRGGSGLLTDAATAYLAAALALAASAWKGRFGWATVLGVAGTLAFYEAAALANMTLAYGVNHGPLEWCLWARGYHFVEPQFTVLVWVSAAAYAAAALLVAEWALRRGARNFDRLVTD
jgi:hypothetical protein